MRIVEVVLDLNKTSREFLGGIRCLCTPLRVFKLLERSCLLEQETVNRGEVEEFKCVRARLPSIAIDEDSIVDTQDN